MLGTSPGVFKRVKRNAFFDYVRNTSDVCTVTWAWKRSKGTRYRYIKRIDATLVNTEG